MFVEKLLVNVNDYFEMKRNNSSVVNIVRISIHFLTMNNMASIELLHRSNQEVFA
ncbi:hypothetical protein T479_08525 [Lysinibacillus varians]|nr:hypothetical protein T479_08525 [Lysinibacillus varians]